MIKRRFFGVLLLCTMFMMALGVPAMAAADRGVGKRIIIKVFELPKMTDEQGVGTEQIVGFADEGYTGGGWYQEGATWNYLKSQFHCYVYYNHPTYSHDSWVHNQNGNWTISPWTAAGQTSHADGYYDQSDYMTYGVDY